jgi:F0F1-type ATP synthase membrane subunit a
MAELAHRGLWALALAVLVMNLPFGFWRAGAKRFTRPWFVAVHAPVPFVIFLRVVSGIGWHLVSFPVLIGAFFTGQFLGGVMRRR